jgi:hypothetical protein
MELLSPESNENNKGGDDCIVGAVKMSIMVLRSEFEGGRVASATGIICIFVAYRVLYP